MYWKSSLLSRGRCCSAVAGKRGSAMASDRLKRILHWTGALLGIVGVVFVAIKLYEYGGQIDFSRFTSGKLQALFGLTVIYTAANFLLALAWKALLQHFEIAVNFAWVIKTYGVSQLAKYVPGNIFHLAGRQAIGQAAGLSAWPLAKSAVWELGLISVTGAMFGVLVLPYFVSWVSNLMAIIAFVCVLITVAMGLRKFVGPRAACAAGWYVIFLTASGFVFVGLLALVKEDGIITLLQVLPFCGAFVAAWLVGLVTPGAPAGIGVRELVLMVLLKGLVSEADLTLAVVLGRLVTVGGDLVFFAVASLMRGKRITS